MQQQLYLHLAASLQAGPTALRPWSCPSPGLLPNLTRLAFGGDRIRDAGLAPLSRLTSLHHLTLEWVTGVSGRGLAVLRGCRGLELLNLYYYTGLSDAGLAAAQLTELRELDVSGAQASDLTSLHRLT